MVGLRRVGWGCGVLVQGGLHGGWLRRGGVGALRTHLDAQVHVWQQHKLVHRVPERAAAVSCWRQAEVQPLEALALQVAEGSALQLVVVRDCEGSQQLAGGWQLHLCPFLRLRGLPSLPWLHQLYECVICGHDRHVSGCTSHHGWWLFRDPRAAAG